MHARTPTIPFIERSRLDGDRSVRALLSPILLYGLIHTNRTVTRT
jgi:hypothetical protein